MQKPTDISEPTISRLTQETIAQVMAQREEILKAFIAKYGCDPDECIQYTQNEGFRARWWVEKR